MTIKQTIQSWAQKAFGISQYAQMWLAGMDTPDSQSSKPSKPYKQVALVFTCVNKIINSISGLPLVLSTIDEKIIESGTAYDLFFNNPAMSWQRFVFSAIGHYVLSGDVFFVFPEIDSTGPKEILIVSGKQMHPITHNRRPDGDLIGWEFRGLHGQRAKFTLEEVYQWKNFNPYDRFHGLGPLEASGLNINYSFAADLYNSNALENAAEPGAILTAPGDLTEDQVRMIRSQFDARHRGAGQAKRTALLTGGLDIKTIAMKMSDMQVAKITEMSDKKICSCFGVPPGVAGLITEAQYSHGPAMQDFIFNTILPLAALFGDEITAGILSKFSSSKWISNSFNPVDVKDAKLYSGPRNKPLAKNIYYRKARHKSIAVQKKVLAWFDAGQHPVVQEHQREIAEKVIKFTEAGVMLNDIIETHDLPYEQVPWGNDWWIGMGLVPARFALEAGLEGLTGPSLPEGQEDGKATLTQNSKLKTQNSEAQRLRLWRNWVGSWAGIEREYKESMRKYFLRQQRILTDKLKKAFAENRASSPVTRGPSSERRATSDEVIARVVFDLKTENSKIKVINQVFFEKGSELGIRQSLSQLSGLTGDALDEAAERVKLSPRIKGKLVISSHKVTGINRTTQDIIANQLSEGLESGEGLGELTSRIKQTLGSNRQRALRIARTQTAGAVGTGRHEGMRHAGTELKSWITSGDSQVRDAHTQAGIRYAAGIPLDVPFDVAGEMLMYPGDPAGSAANIINCRCLEIARRAAGKNFDSAYYANMNFYSYSEMQKAKEKNKDKQDEN